MKIGNLSILILFILAACQPQGAPKTAHITLHVFAAASLVESFEELGAQFEAQHAGVKVIYNFAGSQQLAQQIGQGAVADVFASADSEKMQMLVQDGQILAEHSQMFAQNSLVVIYPLSHPAPLQNLQDLARPGLKLALAASAVPVGHYSLAFLEKAAQDPRYGPQFRQQVLDNVVTYEENVRAVLSKVILGEADAGIVYTSDVGNHPLGSLEIPATLNVNASYYIAPLAGASQPELAQAFIALVNSPLGAQILLRYGLVPMKP